MAIVAGAIVLLLGILFLMGPRFEALLLCHAFWVRWDRVLRGSGRQPVSREVDR